MDESASIESWNHTTELMALLANLHRNAEQTPEPYHPRMFHPHYQHDLEQIEDEDFDPIQCLERSGF